MGVGSNSLAFLRMHVLVPELGLLLLLGLHRGLACVRRSELAVFLDLTRPHREDEADLHPLPPCPDSICPHQWFMLEKTRPEPSSSI